MKYWTPEEAHIKLTQANVRGMDDPYPGYPYRWYYNTSGVLCCEPWRSIPTSYPQFVNRKFDERVATTLHPFLKKYIFLKHRLGLDTFTAAKIAQWTVESANVAAHHAGIHIDSQLRAYEKMQE